MLPSSALQEPPRKQMVARIVPLLLVVAHAEIDLQTYSAERSINQWSFRDQEKQLQKDMDAAQNSYAEFTATASLESKLDVQLDGANTLLQIMNDVGEKEEAMHKQELEVTKLEGSHDDIKKQLDHKKAQKNTDVTNLEMHATCVLKLQDLELKLPASERSYDRARWQYAEDGHNEHIWAAMDELASDAFDLYTTQKECAPGSAVIEKVPEPPRCDADTGGTCEFLSCHQDRNAICGEWDWAAMTRPCLCPPGSCAKNGNCVERPDPLKAPADPLAV